MGVLIHNMCVEDNLKESPTMLPCWSLGLSSDSQVRWQPLSARSPITGQFLNFIMYIVSYHLKLKA